MPGLTLSDRVAIPDSVIARELDGETVVLNLETGVYFGLDAVATAIWNALQNGGCLDDAFNAVGAQYDVDADTLKRDLLQFVDQLVAKQLLQA